MKKKNYTILSFYKFFEITNPLNFKIKLKNLYNYKNIKGIILLAEEGINLNVSCSIKDTLDIVRFINEEITLTDNLIKYSYSNQHIYQRLKIKVKEEILTTRNNYTNPNKSVGEYIEPKDWDKIVKDNEAIIIDTRNTYEIEVGTFKNSLNPNAKNFSEIIKWLDKNIVPKIKKTPNKKIAMFCTGGIRCEKATAYIKSKGAHQVLHLKGGILKYLEENKKSDLWNGECFVFDNRVTLQNNLKKGQYDLCHACRMPLNKKDVLKIEYIKGVSCHKCYNTKTLSQIKRYKEKIKQITLAKKRKQLRT